MHKRILIFLSCLLCLVLMAGCSCQHEWSEATCTAPKTCKLCQMQEGESLGHSWVSADCETPKTCSGCGLTEGAPLGHTWAEATCSGPKTCTACAATEGQPLEHSWEGEATLFTAPVCSVCGTAGEPLPGYFAQNGLVVHSTPWKPVDYITNTYVRPDLDTTGAFLASDVWIFDSDETHRAKKGYEWRCMDITIVFSDNRSSLYGTNVSCALANYYQDLELKQAVKQDRFSVTYQGKEYQCLALYENAGFRFTDNSNIFEMTVCVQVPVGYDGVVLAFHHGGIDADGKHLHELEDENMLLLRMANLSE